MVSVTLEAAVLSCYVKKPFLEVLENSQENTCARDPLLIKLQAIDHLWWLLLNLLTVKLLAKLRIAVHNAIYVEHLMKEHFPTARSCFTVINVVFPICLFCFPLRD